MNKIFIRLYNKSEQIDLITIHRNKRLERGNDYTNNFESQLTLDKTAIRMLI